MSYYDLIAAEQALKDALPSRTSTFLTLMSSCRLHRRAPISWNILILRSIYQCSTKSIVQSCHFEVFSQHEEVSVNMNSYKAFEEYYSQELLSFLHCNLK